MNTIKATEIFMNAAGQEVKPAPGQPSEDVLKLRLSLELEELYEKAQAFGIEGTFQYMLLDKLNDKNCLSIDIWNNNIKLIDDGDTGKYDPVAVLDACADQRVVADGTILACGLQGVFEEAMNIVHESNMSKFCTDMNEAAQTSVAYKEKGIETAWFARGGKWVVTRTSDAKILKSLNYKPANLAPLLDHV